MSNITEITVGGTTYNLKDNSAVRTVNGTSPDANGNVEVSGGSDYILPTASATVKGGVKVNGVKGNGGYTMSGLVMDGDVLSLNWTPINYTYLGKPIENLWPDHIRIQKQDFYRFGGLCLFTYQIFVDVEIETEYGFSIATLPCSSAMRTWLNNSTKFYLNGVDGDKRLLVNGTKLATGNYILSGIYPTNDVI